MRFSALLLGIVTCLTLAGPAAVSRAIADDAYTCVHGADEVQIAACTRVINSGRVQGHNLAVTYYNRGTGYRKKDDQDRAIADYNESIRLDPNDADAYDNRGNAYRDKGDYDRAIADYNEALRLDPKLANAYQNRSIAYEDKGDYDRAIADATEAIRLNTTDAMAYYYRGAGYDAKGDHDRAIADFSEAIRLNPKDADAYNDRGEAYRAKGDYDHAFADYNESIRIDPENVNAIIDRGYTYLANGNHDSAIRDYNQAITLYPRRTSKVGLTLAYEGRGQASLYAGALPRALADFDKASSLDPTSAYAALWLDIVAQRNNVQSRLSEAISKIDMTTWPAPVIRMFLGQMTPAAVLAAADDPDATKKRGQICIANYFIGEWMLRQDATEEATRLLRLAAADCAKDSRYLAAAKAELKALGVSP